MTNSKQRLSDDKLHLTLLELNNLDDTFVGCLHSTDQNLTFNALPFVKDRHQTVNQMEESYAKERVLVVV